jgi:hypothetical protein
VASSASREESEEMYSGTSSVPMLSSGSKSRLKREKQEEVKCKIMRETGSKSRENSLSNRAFLWRAALLGLLALVHGLGVFPLETGEEMRNDG